MNKGMTGFTIKSHFDGRDRLFGIFTTVWSRH